MLPDNIVSFRWYAGKWLVMVMFCVLSFLLFCYDCISSTLKDIGRYKVSVRKKISYGHSRSSYFKHLKSLILQIDKYKIAKGMVIILFSKEKCIIKDRLLTFFFHSKNSNLYLSEHLIWVLCSIDLTWSFILLANFKK